MAKTLTVPVVESGTNVELDRAKRPVTIYVSGAAWNKILGVYGKWLAQGQEATRQAFLGDCLMRGIEDVKIDCDNADLALATGFDELDRENSSEGDKNGGRDI